jgi:hypothetical protein
MNRQHPRPVFSSHLISNNRVVTLREVQDYIDVTRTLDRAERIQYFGSVGVDYENVERYGVIVERLNESFNQCNNNTNTFTEWLYKLHVATMFCVSYIWH